MTSRQDIREMLTAIDRCRSNSPGYRGARSETIGIDAALLDQLATLLEECLDPSTRVTPRDNGADPDTLTKRQREILTWVAAGKSNSVIADILGISHHTVDTHLRRAFERLGTTDRTVAAIRSVQAGYIAPDGLLAA